MRLQFRAAVTVLLCLCATACAEQQTAALGRPNAIIVREFALNQAAITLDPTFGFSLYRGTPGVPPRQRAASVVVERTSSILNGGAGLTVQGSFAYATLKDATILSHATGLSASGGGTILSYQNNALTGNAVDGAPTAALSLK